MDRKYHNLKVVLDCAIDRLNSTTLSGASSRLMKIASLFDISAAIDFFAIELEDMKTKYNPYIDADFDFDNMIPSNPFFGKSSMFPVLEEMRKQSFIDVARDAYSVSECYFPSEKADDIAQLQWEKPALYEESLKKKEARDLFRKSLISIERGEFISDFEIEEALRSAIDTLINTLHKIQYEITNYTRDSDIKGKALFDELAMKYIPEGFMSVWDSFKDYKKWKDECIVDIAIEAKKDHIAKHLKDVLEFFIVDDPEHELPSLIKKYEKEFEDMFADYINSQKMKAKYAILRSFMKYDNGLLFVSDESKLGKYIFMNRKELSSENIEMLFDFIGLNLVVQKEEGMKEVVEQKKDDAEEQKIVENNYPVINEEHKKFFENKIYWDGGVKKRIDVPKDEILHCIYDIMKVNDKEDSKLCRMVYIAMKELTLFKGERKKYTPFVKSVVKYVFPGADEKKTADNIRSVKIGNDLTDMDKDYKEPYRVLRDKIKQVIADSVKKKTDSVK